MPLTRRFLNEEAQYDIPACYELPSSTEKQVADPYVFGPPGSGSVCQRYESGSTENSKKNLDFYCFVISL
jgi:hypothetical protein